MKDEKDIAATIIPVEQAVLDRWRKGDTSGFPGTSAPNANCQQRKRRS